MRFEIENMRGGYTHVVDEVRRKGQRVSPRGIPTVEVLGAQIIVEDLTDCLPVGINRNFNTRFAAVEAAQLIGGVSDVELTLRINPTMEQFLDVRSPLHDRRTESQQRYFHGAYGPRIRPHVQEAVYKLRKDPDSRQAVVTIFQSHEDLGILRRDTPCTLSLHFMIRSGRLDLHVTMRSNDVWWGLAYDVFQFTQLQWTVARALDVEIGHYYHNANSLHAYERDFDAMDKLTPPETSRETFHPLGFGVSADWAGSGNVIGDFQFRARSILSNHALFNATPSEDWYRRKLHAPE